MEVTTIKSGELVTLQEMNASSPFFTHGNSVRVIGKLQEYSAETCMATIVEGNAKLKIDTQHLRDINFHVDSIYQFIGELHLKPGNEGVLQARAGRNVDGVDLKLYHQSLQLLRQFQAERKGPGISLHEMSSVIADLLTRVLRENFGFQMTCVNGETQSILGVSAQILRTDVSNVPNSDQ